VTDFAPLASYTVCEVRGVETITVYIDILFLINLTADYFLLLAVATVRRLLFRRLRLLLGAAVGAVYSCLVFFPSLSVFAAVFFKLTASAAVLLIAFPFRSLRSFFFNFLCFYAASALFAGVLFAVSLAAPRGAVFSNGEVYLNLSVPTLLLTATGAYLLLWLSSRFSVRHKRLCSLSVAAEGKTVRAVALCDTGNLLTEPLSGAPCAVMSLAAVKPLFPADVAEAFASGDVSRIKTAAWLRRICFVPCTTVTGSGLLPAFRPDGVWCDGKKAETKCCIAVKPEGFCAEYDALCGVLTGGG